jgi:hypothetical protein
MKSAVVKIFAATLLLLAAHGPASAGPTPERAASCVAALKVRADALTKKLQAGDSKVQPELTKILEHGFAFIGDAYLQGHRDKKAAEARLKAAEEAQAGLPEAQLTQRQAECSREATKLLAETAAINRMMVAGAARARVSKLKNATPATPGV